MPPKSKPSPSQKPSPEPTLTDNPNPSPEASPSPTPASAAGSAEPFPEVQVSDFQGEDLDATAADAAAPAAPVPGSRMSQGEFRLCVKGLFDGGAVMTGTEGLAIQPGAEQELCDRFADNLYSVAAETPWLSWLIQHGNPWLAVCLSGGMLMMAKLPAMQQAMSKARAMTRGQSSFQDPASEPVPDAA